MIKSLLTNDKNVESTEFENSKMIYNTDIKLFTILKKKTKREKDERENSKMKPVFVQELMFIVLITSETLQQNIRIYKEELEKINMR